MPGHGSLAWRVCALLQRNPEEAYSTKDLALKFDVPAHAVEKHLQPFVRSGAFRFARGEWSIGPLPINVNGAAALRASLTTTIKARREHTVQRFAIRAAADKTIGIYRLPDAETPAPASAAPAKAERATTACNGTKGS